MAPKVHKQNKTVEVPENSKVDILEDSRVVRLPHAQPVLSMFLHQEGLAEKEAVPSCPLSSPVKVSVSHYCRRTSELLCRNVVSEERGPGAS